MWTQSVEQPREARGALAPCPAVQAVPIPCSLPAGLSAVGLSCGIPQPNGRRSCAVVRHFLFPKHRFSVNQSLRAMRATLSSLNERHWRFSEAFLLFFRHCLAPDCWKPLEPTCVCVSRLPWLSQRNRSFAVSISQKSSLNFLDLPLLSWECRTPLPRIRQQNFLH